MIGTMRKDRGMDRLMDRVGAERLGFTVEHHSVPVELYAFYRASSRRLPLPAADEALVTVLLSQNSGGNR
jgi:hypothetical protein